MACDRQLRLRLKTKGLGANGRRLVGSDGLGLSGNQTVSPVVGDGAVNNGAAVETFPCIEHEKEIRKSVQHHHPLALRTFH